MDTRMSKYHSSEDLTGSRVQKNKNLYNQRNIDDDNIDINNNVSIIDSGALKKIIGGEENTVEESDNDFFEYEEEAYDNTKEYDLKKIIAEAHKEKPNDYESMRFKKVRESEYEILSSLNFPKKEEVSIPPLSDDEKTLVDLIKTVEMNALKRSEEKEQNLMDDLMGNENTEVLDPVNLDEDTDPTIPKPTIVEELEKTKQLSRVDINAAIENSIQEESIEKHDNSKEEKKNTKEIPLVNSFYTGNLSIKKRDLDDFKDLEKELKGPSVFVKILIVVIILIVLAAGFYFVNKHFNLGLF